MWSKREVETARRGQWPRPARWGSLLGLCLGLLAALGWAMPVLAQDGIEVRMIASTAGEAETVFNGDTVAYTIIVNNNTAAPITNLFILDVLPENVLDNVQCLDAEAASPCELINEVRVVPEPLGGTITVTTTRQISWTVGSVAPNSSHQVSFLARVIGQAEGASFTNVAFVSYGQGGLTKTQASNEVKLTVRLRVELGGATALSETPTWFSQDVGGTLSMDWADFDGDGDLDLALGSTVGTTIYRNRAGQLELFWESPRRAFGVRWADFDRNGRPDLAAVGDVSGDDESNLAQLPGNNYIYTFDPSAGATNRRFVESDVFTSTVQMVRVEPADFNGDGLVDIVASTNAINPECPVRLYLNQGAGRFGLGDCVSRAATAALKPADFDNDGDMDLALGLFPNRVRLLVNDGSGRFTQPPVEVEEAVMFLPYDFAFGDYDGDGFLDLAAAYPLMREVRVYRNLNGAGFARPISIRTSVFLTPYALDWGDVSGDGRIDLAVADAPPKVYVYNPSTGSFALFYALAEGVVKGQVWSLRTVDQNNDGDIDLTLSDRDGPSLVISNFRPPLSRTRLPIPGVAPFSSSSPASSVVWGDADGDGDLDLLFGAGPATAGAAALNSKLYFNDEGEFPASAARAYSGFGPHHVAFGDADQDGDMDVALGTTTEQRLHQAGDFLAPVWLQAEAGEKVLAWGDVDGDVDLDLLVAASLGDDGHVEVFENDSTGQLGDRPIWREAIPGARVAAWGDFDLDGFLDVAVGVDGGANRIYRNNRDNTFSLYWTAPTSQATRSLAWGDYDGDGDPDLAVGNFGEANLLYENRAQATDRTFVQVYATTETSRTTSLAWGDWDNDGDLDLATGNYEEQDQIYVNLGSRPGNPQFFWLWSSEETLRTTGVAFGDKDNDGDLDLAVSQDGATLNGIYENHLAAPTHLATIQAKAPLINPPLYLYTGRPGNTDIAYNFSSAELLSGPVQREVPIQFRIYNPSRQQAAALSAAASTELTPTVLYEYSLDGGGVWRPATAITNSLIPITDSQGLGFQGTYIWDAIRDQAISDDARFRISVIQTDASGPVQRAFASTISPPFRVRAITCIWPELPEVRPSPAQSGASVGDESVDYVVAANETIRFTGRIAAGTGPIFYTWDFGDGSTAAGQVVDKVFSNGTYRVRMSVHGEPCPQTRERAKTITVRAGTGVPDMYLPLIRTGRTVTASVASAAPSETPDGAAGTGIAERLPPARPPQVEGLAGDVQFDTGAVWLRWQPASVEVSGYRVYRGDREAVEEVALLAELPAGAAAFHDPSPGCNQLYYVTAFVALEAPQPGVVESLPSTSSYYGPLCNE
ncbi:MAG TPA: FG-GAP-like repeat-containing protein [Caldilineaceae bacterium]|nr:FG-GAP-like repeat-containing protein [Caldilineaceae bacterium]